MCTIIKPSTGKYMDSLEISYKNIVLMIIRIKTFFPAENSTEYTLLLKLNSYYMSIKHNWYQYKISQMAEFLILKVFCAYTCQVFMQ